MSEQCKMTPAELRRCAERVKSNVWEVDGYLDKPEPHRWQDAFDECIGDGRKLADHILSTVREDDDELLTRDWLHSLGPHCFYRKGYYHLCGVLHLEPFVQGETDFVFLRATSTHDETVTVEVRTRRQLRQLLAGLGVGE